MNSPGAEAQRVVTVTVYVTVVQTVPIYIPVTAYVTLSSIATSIMMLTTTAVSVSLGTSTLWNTVTSVTTAMGIFGPAPSTIFGPYSDLAMVSGGALAGAAAASIGLVSRFRPKADKIRIDSAMPISRAGEVTPPPGIRPQVGKVAVPPITRIESQIDKVGPPRLESQVDKVSPARLELQEDKVTLPPGIKSQADKVPLMPVSKADEISRMPVATEILRELPEPWYNLAKKMLEIEDTWKRIQAYGLRKWNALDQLAPIDLNAANQKADQMEKTLEEIIKMMNQIQQSIIRDFT